MKQIIENLEISSGAKLRTVPGLTAGRNQGGKGSHTCSNARRNSTNPAIYVILPFLTLPKGPLQAGGIHKGKVLMAEYREGYEKLLFKVTLTNFVQTYKGIKELRGGCCN